MRAETLTVDTICRSHRHAVVCVACIKVSHTCLVALAELLQLVLEVHVVEQHLIVGSQRLTLFIVQLSCSAHGICDSS